MYMLGERREAGSVPFLINALTSEGDLDVEVAADALSKIGTSDIVEAIKERFFSGGLVFPSVRIGCTCKY
jgi:HEAT repeat protein